VTSKKNRWSKRNFCTKKTDGQKEIFALFWFLISQQNKKNFSALRSIFLIVFQVFVLDFCPGLQIFFPIFKKILSHMYDR